MPAKRDSHIVHLRIPFATLCGVLDFTKGSADTLSGSVALFLNSVVAGMRKQGAIPDIEDDPRVELTRLLSKYNMAVLTSALDDSSDEPHFVLTGNQPRDDEPTVNVRELLRAQIAQAEQRVVQPQAEVKHYDFEHGPGYEDVATAARRAARPKPDIDTIPKLEWSQIEEWAPLDRFVQHANDIQDQVLIMTIRIVYKNLPLSSWGTAAAEKLITSTYPMVEYGMSDSTIAVDPNENLG